MQGRESTLALKPKAVITRSPKQVFQLTHQKGLMPAKIFKRRKEKGSILSKVISRLGYAPCNKKIGFQSCGHRISPPFCEFNSFEN